ncbi:glycoside hydrolase family 97 C-terminal domain-containing protein [Sphingomicrobium clamense]|uniref:Glycoside hydrolase family 97 C-terminal domain-containing protein n=1 Tax=Sphingomicrobium clamense TaxID=2851013 RepID=A0ABS6V742_9SPHN|nr:glycoside hydrolase family 97 C-terminal domain-containing protein [Sphingomicrobium sp. B8]MBW0145397.1 glycoside hydrolase family 97 C-terminal domain-containing protein [Sphingomicrobium sp. B8]
MVAHLPEHYAEHPEAFDFIKQVPVDWEESLVLDSAVGDYVTIARKERGGESWWLGGGTDETGRTVDVAPDFLDAGRRYVATVYRDAEGTHYQGPTRFDFEIVRYAKTSADTLSLTMAPGGGYAVAIRPE